MNGPSVYRENGTEVPIALETTVDPRPRRWEHIDQGGRRTPDPLRDPVPRNARRFRSLQHVQRVGTRQLGPLLLEGGWPVEEIQPDDPITEAEYGPVPFRA